MEKWEESYILSKLPELVPVSICRQSLLNILKSGGVIGDQDVQTMLLAGKTEYERSSEMYSILKTRIGAYQMLADALLTDSQSGAYRILQQGILLNDERLRSEVVIPRGGTVASWKDLDVDAQDGALQQKIQFQNDIVPLQSLGLEVAELNEMMKDKFLTELMSGMCPELVKNSIPAKPSYYVKRLISNTRSVSPNILKSGGNDIFVIRGAELYQLANLGVDVYESFTQTVGVTARFIQLVFDEDYDRICELTSDPVHLLSYHKGQLFWLKSRGSLKWIQKHIQQHEQQLMDEEMFTQECMTSASPICIADTPGMGKSFLLAKIAETISKANPGTLVRFIVLREFIKEIQNEFLTPEVVRQRIAMASSAFDIGKKLVLSALRSTKVRSFLLFDGYDEVPEGQVPLANQLLQCAKKLDNTQIYVTTRPHMKHKLEEELGALGYTITPFKDQDQVDFLLGFWEEQGAKKNERLIRFAESCLQNLKNNSSNFERDIAGIPLQCKLLAQLHSHQAIQYSKLNTSEHCSVVLPVLKETWKPVFQIYQNSIDIGFDKLMSLSAHLNLNCEATIDAVWNAHMYYAIELLFPDQKPEFANLLGHGAIGEHKSLIYTPGILEEGEGESPRFVHRTFAEYLVALLSVRFIESRQGLNLLGSMLSTSGTCETLIEDTWVGELQDSIESHTFVHPVICYFLDALIKSSEIGKSEKVLETIYHHPSISANFLQIYASSVVSDSPGIASLLIKLFGSWWKIIHWQYLLLLAAKHSGKDTLEQLKHFMSITSYLIFFQTQLAEDKISFDLEYPSASSTFVVTPLHIAAQKGKFNVSVFLLDKCGFRNMLAADHVNAKWLLHIIVFGSSTNSHAVINRKIQLVKLLLDENTGIRRILEEKLPGGTTPLLQNNVHLELIRCMIEGGADVNACTDNQECILHTVLKNRKDVVTPSQYHDLVQQLNPLDFDHYDMRDSAGRTPLHAAVQTIEIQMSTIDIFAKKLVSLDAADKGGEHLLFAAIRGGRSVELIDFICRFTPKSTQELRNVAGESALHLAAKHGNVSAVKYLLLKAPLLVDEVQKNGNNALHAAMSQNTNVHAEIQLMLISANVNLLAVNKKGLTPLMLGLKHGKGVRMWIIRAIEKRHPTMIEENANMCLKALLSNGNIMVWEWDHEIISVAEYFIQMGAVLKGRSAENPWKIHQVNASMSRIADATVCTDRLLQKLVKCGVIKSDDMANIMSTHQDYKSQNMYDLLKPAQGSYESIMLSLIACNQLSPFLMLRQCLHLDQNEFTRFVTPPKGLMGFMANREVGVLVIHTRDIKSTIVRIRDTVNPDIIFEELTEEWKPSIHEADAAVHFLLGNTVDQLSKILPITNKVVFILEKEEECKLNFHQTPIHSTRDTFTLEDLSTILQSIAKRVLQSFPNASKLAENLVILEDTYLQNATTLGTEVMTHATKQRRRQARHPYVICKRTVVSNAIFEHIVGDVLVFKGIGVEELRGRSKVCQSVGRASDHVICDYLTFDTEEDFDWICEHAVGAVHLIECQNHVLRHLQSHGCSTGILRFLDVCESDTVRQEELISLDSVVLIINSPNALLRKQFIRSVKLAYSDHAWYHIELNKISEIVAKHNKGRPKLSKNAMYDSIVELVALDGVKEWDVQKSIVFKEIELVVFIENFSSTVVINSGLDRLRELKDFIRMEGMKIRFWLFTNEITSSLVGEKLVQVMFDLRELSREQIIGLTVKFLSRTSGELNTKRFPQIACTLLEAYENQVLQKIPRCGNEVISHFKFSGLNIHPADNPHFYTYLLAKYAENNETQRQGHANYEIKSLTNLCQKVFANQNVSRLLRVAMNHCYPEHIQILQNFDEAQDSRNLSQILGIEESDDAYDHVVEQTANFLLAQMLVDVACQDSLDPKYVKLLSADQLRHLLRS